MCRYNSLSKFYFVVVVKSYIAIIIASDKNGGSIPQAPLLLAGCIKNCIKNRDFYLKNLFLKFKSDFFIYIG